MDRQAGRAAIQRDGVTEQSGTVGPSFDSYGGTGPENYERYFVPVIGAPLAADLVETAALRPGERVLDVACGTGVVARLAAGRVGPAGTVVGLDVNPGMLAVARAATPPGTAIDWHQAPAHAAPLPDGAFDVVTCQLGLQFFPDQAAALAEMHRVLAPGGRVVLNVPGPIPGLFAILAEELTRHIRAGLAPFVQQVFSLHDTRQLRALLTRAGFAAATAEPRTKALALPPPADFLWQYVHSTPLAAAAAEAGESARAALERDIAARWEPFTRGDGLMLELRVVTASARATQNSGTPRSGADSAPAVERKYGPVLGHK